MKENSTLYCMDMYQTYIENEMKADPSLYTVFDSVLSMKGVRVLMKKDSSGVESVVMSYSIFRSILEKCNKLIIDIVIQGEPFYFGKSLGYMRGIRIERNFNKKVVDFSATKRYRKEQPDTDVVVYRLEDSYCRISWEKMRDLRNSSVYELETPKGFKRKFSNALLSDPLLELGLPFFKYNTRR